MTTSSSPAGTQAAAGDDGDRATVEEFATATSAELARPGGMDDYLAEPIRRDGLVEALRRAPVRTPPDPGPPDREPADRGPSVLRESADSSGPDGVVAELVDAAVERDAADPVTRLREVTARA